MDEEFLEGVNPNQTIDDVNMPAVTASLEMLTVNTNLHSSPENNRVLRKRIPKRVSTEFLNRRCSLRPKKRTCKEMESDEDIKDYYLDKTLKKKANTLETIFEETANANENSTYMSAKRYKRMIQFQQQPTDSKLKKRRTKIKKVFGAKVNFRRKRGSMQVLLDKLNHIRSNSPINSESEIK
ncbi:hypothetical protein KPH14_011763 [Odynerus spinipes]|uniref:Tantalus-like domain-containing protein n=1 Tax=Odynerus spinipes TaxID=1348599 RepID=A0AAD9VTR4_9HYME|nr:hypothetical protein KPH14_011763 [Odynerus spinipes]